MFIAHTAVGIAAAGIFKERRVLTYFALAANAIDISTYTLILLGSTFNFHSPLGIAILTVGFTLLGLLLFRKVQIALLSGFLVISHMILDIPVSNSGAWNLYGHPWYDFLIEVFILVFALWFYKKKLNIIGRDYRAFIVLSITLVAFQALWCFIFNDPNFYK